MEDRHDLPTLLDVVRDVKEEYYVGTQEALEAVRGRMSIYRKPQETADHINSQLPAGNGFYRATPERLAGICKLAQCSPITRLHGSEEPSRLCDLFGEGWTLASGAVFGPYSVMGTGAGEAGISSAREIFVDLFKRANDEGVKDDEAFKEFIALEFYNGERNKIDLQTPEPDATSYRFYERVMSHPTDLIFSRKTFLDGERDSLGRSDRHSLNLRMISDRIHRDQVDHRFEFRRRFITNYLEMTSGQSVEDLTAYEDGVLSISKERLKHFEEGLSPDCFLNKERSLVRYHAFVRHLLGSEKNFARKFLGS